MKGKRIRIDWESLEDAFSSQRDEMESYLDLVTGHVVLEGEGEEDDTEDDDGRFDASVPNAVREAPRDATRLYVPPPDTELKLQWMEQFLEAGRQIDPQEVARLREALEDDDPVERLGAILNQNPDVRDAWYAFRADRVHERIDGWLAENGVEASEPPPWRRR